MKKHKIPQIKANIKLFNNNEVVLYTTLRQKAKIHGLVRRDKFLECKWERGVCVIYYNSRQTYWNKFTFNSIPELIEKFNDSCEPQLLAFLNTDPISF